jgi:hypothetical protein
VLPSARLTEESVESVVTATDGLVARHLPIRLDSMLEAEELPACIANLDAGLSNVDAKGFAHGSWLEGGRGGLLKGRIEGG